MQAKSQSLDVLGCTAYFRHCAVAGIIISACKVFGVFVMDSGLVDILGFALSSATTVAGCVWFVSGRFQRIQSDVQRLIGKLDSDIAKLSGKLDSHMARVDGEIQVLNSRAAALSERVATLESMLAKVSEDSQEVRERLSVIEYATK